MQTLNTVRPRVAPLELRLIASTCSLPNRAPNPTVRPRRPSPSNPIFFRFPHPPKTGLFFRLSLLILIGERKSPPTAHFLAVQTPHFSCRPLLPCGIVNLSNARLQKTSPNSRTERQKNGYR